MPILLRDCNQDVNELILWVAVIGSDGLSRWVISTLNVVVGGRAGHERRSMKRAASRRKNRGVEDGMRWDILASIAWRGGLGNRAVRGW